MKKLFLFVLLLCSLSAYTQVKSDTEMGTYNNTYIKSGILGGISATSHNTFNRYLIASKIHKDSLDNVRILSETELEVTYKGATDTIEFTPGGYWSLEDDTLYTVYSVAIDSSFRMWYDSCYLGYHPNPMAIETGFTNGLRMAIKNNDSTSFFATGFGNGENVYASYMYSGIQLTSPDELGVPQAYIATMYNTTTDLPSIEIAALDGTGDAGGFLIYPDSTTINGQAFAPDIDSASTDYGLYFNKTTGKITYDSSGAVGGAGTNYWTLTGNDIANNNAGDVYISGMTRPDSVKIDSLRGDKPGIEINQVDSVLQDLSSNTGTDYTISTLYTAFKFTADHSETYRAAALRLKTSGTVSNSTAYLQYKIYTDVSGSPGSNISYAFETVPYGVLTSSFVEHPMQVGQSPELVSGTSYWLVVIASALPAGGGSVLIDCANTGTNTYATSTNGISWTPASNYSAWIKFYYSNYAGILVQAKNQIGVESYSVSEYGVMGTSYYDAGGRFISTTSQGVIGKSTYGQGVYGTSINSVGVQALSTNAEALTAKSTNHNGIYGESLGSGYAGVKGYSSTTSNGVYGQSTGSGYGVQALSTGNYSLYATNASASYGAAWMRNNTSGTNDLVRVVNINRGTTGTAAAGIGGSLDFFNENASGVDVLQARIGCVSQKTINGSERGAITFYTKGDNNPPQLRMTIDSSGTLYGTSLNTRATNTAFGYKAGYNIAGTGNVFLGYQAAYNETGSNKLYIENSNSATPLIYGDFSTDAITINGSCSITTFLKLTPTADPPGSAAEGMVYADTDHHLYFYNGTGWVQLDN